MPFVATLIVTWNKKKDVKKLLAQLRTIAYPADCFRIILVDNNSDDGTAQMVRERFPEVRLIANKKNLGGSGGFNTGLRYVLEYLPQSEYIWMLDNDVQIEAQTLYCLVDVLERNPNAAICGSRIMDRETPERLIEIGAFINYRSGNVQPNIPHPNRSGTYHETYIVDYVAACSLLVRTHLIPKVGLWEEKLFIYWDDMEWGARFKKHGYDLLASSRSVVYHPSWTDRQLGVSVVWRNYFRCRNALWFFYNYTRGVHRVLLLPLMVLRFMVFAVNSYLRSFPQLSQAFLYGVVDFFNNRFPKRQLILKTADIAEYAEKNALSPVAVIVFVGQIESQSFDFFFKIKKKLPDITYIAVIPEQAEANWDILCDPENILSYSPSHSNRFSLKNIIDMAMFFKRKRVELLVIPGRHFRLGALFFKNVARVDLDSGFVVGFNKLQLSKLMILLGLAFILPFIILLAIVSDWFKGLRR